MRITNDKTFLKHLKKCPHDFFIIHYSCRGFYLEITSIAVAMYNNEQIISFSPHAIAAELGIKKEEIRNNFDKIELELLRQFYNFVRNHKDKFWVHWMMRHQKFGFEHLEHRYRVLTGKEAVKIPAEQRIDLDVMLASRYGDKYVDSPRMLSLMEINWGRHRDFLEGEEEIKEFEENNFTLMHQSTSVKVSFFCWVMKQMLKGRLKTKSRRVGAMIDKFFESRKTKVATLLFNVIFGFLGAFVTLWTLISIVDSLIQ